MIIDDLKTALDAYATECERVGRSPFLGTAARDMRRAAIDATISGIEVSLMVIRTRSGNDGTEALSACHAIHDIAVSIVGESDDDSYNENNETTETS